MTVSNTNFHDANFHGVSDYSASLTVSHDESNPVDALINNLANKLFKEERKEETSFFSKLFSKKTEEPQTEAPLSEDYLQNPLFLNSFLKNQDQFILLLDKFESGAEHHMGDAVNKISDRLTQAYGDSSWIYDVEGSFKSNNLLSAALNDLVRLNIITPHQNIIIKTAHNKGSRKFIHNKKRSDYLSEIKSQLNNLQSSTRYEDACLAQKNVSHLSSKADRLQLFNKIEIKKINEASQKIFTTRFPVQAPSYQEHIPSAPSAPFESIQVELTSAPTSYENHRSDSLLPPYES